MKKYTHNRTRAFTLIELLVVISIIALLASIVLSFLNVARSRARDAKRKNDIHQIQTALELYFSDHGEYPVSGGATYPAGPGWSDSGDASWTALQTLLSPYLSKLSKDPTDNGVFAGWGGFSYNYYSLLFGCNRGWYLITYQLENADGPDPGTKACDGTSFQYGGLGANTTIKTTGARSK
ncbi:MAG: type II secretion system protein [Patescibacteria group bacterium]